MKELVCEVRERASILLVGIFLVLTGIILVVASAATVTEEDGSLMGAAAVCMLFLVGVGGYTILAFINHRLKVFSDGSMVYSNSIGQKEEFSYTDISEIEQRQVNGTLSLSLKDATGKRIGKVESNMRGYEELAQWLNTQKQKNKDAQAMGVESQHEVEVTPVNGKMSVTGARIWMIFLGMCMFVIGLICFSFMPEKDSAMDSDEEVIWFDPYAVTEEKQTLIFDMVSYPFASFELSDTQGLYFVFDPQMNVYIVCLENERVETEFADIYAYTFDDTLEYPGIAEIDGYAEEIDAELRAIAIEEFNYLWGSEVFTEDNFEDYIGYYYLDTTYQPEEGESPVVVALMTIFFVGMGIYFLYLGIRKPRKPKVEEVPVDPEIVVPEERNAEAIGITHTTDEIGEVPIPRNIVISMLASIVCAAAGGVLWILVYKLGRITALAGYLAVVGAIYGYCKIGRRELNIPAGIWCIFVGLFSICFANYLAYAWEIVDAINASNPGRTDFWHVFGNMPRLMAEMELWTGYFADLAIGIVFALLAGVSNLFGKKKKK